MRCRNVVKWARIRVRVIFRHICVAEVRTDGKKKTVKCESEKNCNMQKVKKRIA